MPLKTSLKKEHFDTKILHCIDKAIGHPIVFHLIRVDADGADNIKVMAAYKRPNEADTTKWVVDNEYFETDWLPENQCANNCLLCLTCLACMKYYCANLYLWTQGKMNSSGIVNLDAQLERTGQVIAKAREYEKLETRMKNEKQFNRQVEMNTELRVLGGEIEKLKQSEKA